MSTQTIAKCLTFAGALLFIVLTVLSISNTQTLTVTPESALLSYGAVIVSFISGIHWGQALNHAHARPLLWHSNIVALLAWLATIQTIGLGIPLLMFCLVYLLVIDFGLMKQGLIRDWFWRLRLQITSIVLLSLLTFLLAR